MSLRILYSVPPDYPEAWERWTRRFHGRGSRRRVRTLVVAGRILEAGYVLMYLLIGWRCALAGPSAFIGYVASTALGVVIVSACVRILTAPRPYEIFDMRPLVPKGRRPQGRSFPSRHAFCAFLVAALVAAIFWPAGAFALLLAATLAIILILEGAHFPRDVVVGAVLGVLWALFCIGAMTVAVG